MNHHESEYQCKLNFRFKLDNVIDLNTLKVCLCFSSSFRKNFAPKVMPIMAFAKTKIITISEVLTIMKVQEKDR